MHGTLLIRRLIWLYFYLWIFEGALRFWVLPGFSDVLLIVRDPVVIGIYLAAVPFDLMPITRLTVGSLLLAGIAFVFAMTLGHGNAFVALYGIRATFLHLPLIFVMQRVWKEKDMEQMGKAILWLSVPMAFLVVYQFKSPAGTWINKGGMLAHYSSVRPAGTFSFVSGMVAFAALVAAFLAHSFTSIRHFGVVRSVAAAFSALAMVAVSNSRTMAFTVGVIFAMMIGLVLFRGTKAVGLLLLLGVVGLASSTLSSAEFFEEGTQSLQRRFVDNAGESGILGSAYERLFGSFSEGVGATSSAEWFGRGIGYGTNAGAQMLTGQRVFLAGETDWTRVIMELGPFLGWYFIAMRLAICWLMLKAGMRSFRAGNLLPMLLFGAGAMPVLIGQWGVPTNQGFATLIAGLCLASGRLVVSGRRPARFVKSEQKSPIETLLSSVG